MQITSIKASKTPNQVWITFSDHSFIPFFIDDIVKLSLIKNQEIDESTYQLIAQTSLEFKGREFSLRQIAISPKVAKVINQKLRLFFQKTIFRYKINTNNLNLNEISQKIIKDLEDRKLLNETDFVNYFVKKNSKKSKQQIIYLLHQFDISQEALFSINFKQENEIEKIKKIISKKKNIDKIKLKSSLYRRGFNISDINSAIDDWSNFR